jgi:hypothetical protein
MAQPGTAWDQYPAEQQFRDERRLHTATLPFDEQLLGALDCRTYDFDELERRTRMAVMRLGMTVAKRLL